jgi:hypothetical protein
MPPSLSPRLAAPALDSRALDPRTPVADLAAVAAAGEVVIVFAGPDRASRLRLRPGRWPGTVVLRRLRAPRH